MSFRKSLDTIERLLKEAEENRAEIKRLQDALKKSEERASVAEGRLVRYEGPGMAYAE